MAENPRRRMLVLFVMAAMAGLAYVIALALGTDLDERVSNLFYDASTSRWLIDHATSPLRLWLYDGPKWLIILMALALIAIVAKPSLAPRRCMARREAAFVLVCLALVPLTIVTVRNHSNVSCPRALRSYGGTADDASGRVSLAGFLEPRRTGGCWPSGHASGGFALLSLAFLARRRSIRRCFIALGLLVGASMGAYQVARGAHFVSHILVAGLMAFLVVTVVALLWTGEVAGRAASMDE